MLRVLHLVSIVFLVAAAVVVYKVKYEANYEAQRVAKLRAEIRAERERLAILRAEWMRLAAPQRIQALAVRHLGLGPLEVARIHDLSGLPEKPPGAGDGDPIGEFISRLSADESRVDPLGDFLRTLNGTGAAGANGPASRSD